VLQSMFNLEHRMAELRPSADELRTARQLRDASTPVQQPTVVTNRPWFDRGVNPTRFTRVAER
jgi:transposase